MLGQQLGGDTVKQLSGQLGADEGTVGNAVSTALPLLLEALARNSSDPDGAAGLSSALARDHDGSILDDLSAFLGGGNTGAGENILGHVFGGRNERVTAGLSRATGLDLNSASSLLAMLAPLVMGALGRVQREQGLDADGLSVLLGNEHTQMEQAAGPELGGLTQLLDADADGQILDDVVRIGAGLLGKFFGEKQ
jgi:hypothetical protein